MMTSESTPDPTDRELAFRITAHADEAAFRILYRRHTPRIWPLVLRMVGGPHAEADAEDVVQETWTRAVAALSSFRWEAAFRTWLTGIALNRSRELLRKRKRSRETQGWDGFDEVASAETTVPGRRLDLEGAIRALPDGYRTVLVLHDVEGFTHDEIAARLDIAPGTSRSQLLRARLAARKLLTVGDEDEDARTA